MGIERGPQLVRHAAPVVLAVLPAAALRRVDRLVDGDDDVRDGDLGRRAREIVATARAADAVDQPRPAQLAEQLLEVGQRDLLALGNRGQRDRAFGPSPVPYIATSIIAVTAKRPFVVRRIVDSPLSACPRGCPKDRARAVLSMTNGH